MRLPGANAGPSQACFLVTDLAATPVGGRLDVEGDEGRHAVSVRRVRLGETVSLTDGRGSLAEGRVVECQPPNRMRVEVDQIRLDPRVVPWIEVGLSVLKGDRMARAIEQLTEVGVEGITPVIADRSVARWQPGRESSEIARLRRRAAEASKQSRRAWLPEVRLPATLSDLLEDRASRLLVVLAEDGPPAGDDWWRDRLVDRIESISEVLVFIGPEGGFSLSEVRALRNAGAHPLALGPGVMRSGTAALAGVVAVSMMSGRWQTGDRD